ncbi:MAG: NADH:ubiquinone reductase (Na(+)-transporting) subunit F [Candidatus Rifleibacteriota bacterium]
MEALTVFVVVNSFILVLCGLITVTSYFFKQTGEVALEINAEKKVEIERGQTLFDALTHNDIYLPAACGGKGTCGRCLLKCIEGAGPVTPMERILLSSEQLEDSYRLACQVKVRENLSVELPAELLAARKYQIRLESAEFTGEGIRTLKFKILNDDLLEFKSGQYVQLYRQLPHEQIVRAYSISSDCRQKSAFTLDIQYVAGGIMSTWLHRLEPGSVLEASGPYGDMFYEPDSYQCPVILVAGGVGLAPVKSILYEILAQKNKPDTWLFWGARHRVNLYAENELRAIAEKNKNWFHFYPALSGDLIEEGWIGNRGFVHETLAQNLPVLPDARAFLCGPAPMMDAVTNVLLNKGLTEEKIKSDPFDFN